MTLDDARMPQPRRRPMPIAALAVVGVLLATLLAATPATAAQLVELRAAETRVLERINAERARRDLRAILRTPASGRSRRRAPRTWSRAATSTTSTLMARGPGSPGRCRDGVVRRGRGRRAQPRVAHLERRYPGRRAMDGLLGSQGPDRLDHVQLRGCRGRGHRGRDELLDRRVHPGPGPLAALADVESLGSATEQRPGTPGMVGVRSATRHADLGDASYDVERRREGGSWALVRSRVSITAASITGTRGVRYQFPGARPRPRRQRRSGRPCGAVTIRWPRRRPRAHTLWNECSITPPARAILGGPVPRTKRPAAALPAEPLAAFHPATRAWFEARSRHRRHPRRRAGPRSPPAHPHLRAHRRWQDPRGVPVVPRPAHGGAAAHDPLARLRVLYVSPGQGARPRRGPQPAGAHGGHPARRGALGGNATDISVGMRTGDAPAEERRAFKLYRGHPGHDGVALPAADLAGP